MARWSTRGTQNTVLIGRQADLTTELTSGLVAIPVTFEADHTQEQEDFSDLASGQFGAYEAPAPGSKSGGTVKMKGRIDALKDGYVPGPLENPGDTGIIAYTMAMIANALGSDSATATDNANFLAGLHMARNPYDAGDVTGGAVGSIDVTTDASYKTGALVYAATDATRSPATRGLGFVATRTGAGPFNLALFESYPTAAASGDNAYGTATGFLSASETWPLTVHHYGDNDGVQVRLHRLRRVASDAGLHVGQDADLRVGFRLHRPQALQHWRRHVGSCGLPECAPVLGSQQRLLHDRRLAGLRLG
jgi:hypothetical protein